MDKSESTTELRSDRPLSPCTLICTLDDDNRCLGCGRSKLQISRWSLMTVDEQWAVIDELAARDPQISATIASDNGD